MTRLGRVAPGDRILRTVIDRGTRQRPEQNLSEHRPDRLHGALRLLRGHVFGDVVQHHVAGFVRQHAGELIAILRHPQQRLVDVDVAAGDRERVGRIATNDVIPDRIRIAGAHRVRNDGSDFVQVLVI